jgi:predicted dehydrogenase
MPIKLGVLGSGLAVEHLHWPALQGLRDLFTITGLCDIDHQAMRTIAALLDNTPLQTTSWDELLASDVDAVLISLPIHLNAEAIRAAVRAGKHVICEKPLAANLPQAEALAAELRDAKPVICIAENFHYRDDLKQARRWMDDGAIGTVVGISLNAWFWSDTSQGFAATRWRQDHQYRGAVIADAGVHHAAGLRALGGDIEQIHAFIKDIHPVLQGPDTMVMNVRFRSGVLGQLFFAAAVKAPQPCFDNFMVLGDAGSIVISNGSATLTRPNHDPETYTAIDSRGYVGEFRNFHAAIRHGEPIVATLDQALADWRVIMKALDAAEGREVALL